MEKLIQRLAQVKDRADSRHLFLALEGLYERLRTQMLSSPEIAMVATSKTTAETTKAVITVVQGRLVALPANTELPTPAGTVANGTFNVFVWSVDLAGNLFVQMGKPGPTLGTLLFPELDIKRAVLGFVIINPTGTGDFVGGTTDLDDATVTPNAQFVSVVGAFDPTADTGI